MTRALWDFPGGLVLDGRRELATQTPVRPARLPKQIILPLHQHIGSTAEPIVEPGQYVKKGEKIARAVDYVSVPVHASTSGWVAAVGNHAVPHPSGLSAPCVIIEPDGEEQWRWRPERIADYTQWDTSALRNHIREAGIVGLGGAAFPTHVKLAPGPDAAIGTLIINGVECEPYITCDDMLMRERADEILEGARIMRYILGGPRCVIAIEDDKPQAVTAVRDAITASEDMDCEVVVVPSRYPSGGEKQLIQILTGREVPVDGLPEDIGVICQNVATAAAVYKAVAWSEPLISRYITITGDGVSSPRNLEALIGTPMSDLIAQCGGYRPGVDRLVMGGTMMGFAVPDDEVPVVKGTNCLVAMSQAAATTPHETMPCIRCGECAEVCPARLLPQQIYLHASADDFDGAQEYDLFECIECGCCAYVCPSHIPLVQYYRYAKTEIWAQQREREKADLARRRYEFRLERLERERREREERRRQKKPNAAADQKADKKQAVAEAAARAKAKRAARGRVPADAATAPAEENTEPVDGLEHPADDNPSGRNDE